MTEKIQPLQPSKKPTQVVEALKLTDDPGSKVLFEGTPNDGTVDEYVLVMLRAIHQHATIPAPTKIKTAGGNKLIKADMVHWEALRHVLMVLLTSNGEQITDDMLRYQPPKATATKSSIVA